MQDKVKALSKKYFQDAVQLRRYMHQYPELSFKETQTANLIAKELEKNNISYQKNIGGNGIVATLKGRNPNKRIIALRADFDALPILEETALEFSSKNKGIMHACGHDMHTASLLSVLKLLNDLKTSWEGTIHFVFQHAEELLPGGAKQMLDANLFGDLQPEFVVAQHVDPDIETGYFGFKSGRYMASNDEIYLTIEGKGGHAAIPHKITDTVLATSQIIINLQQIASRLVPPDIPMVLSFGKLIANGATNVIPNRVDVEGTFRMFDEAQREKVHQHIIRIAESTATSFGTKCKVDIKKGYPVVDNNKELNRIAKQIVSDIFNKNKIIDLGYRMTSEDFGFFSQKYKSLFYRLGVAHKEKSLNYPLHSSRFNPDENALKYSIEFMTMLALKLLS
jgi:amidohydrolase